MSDVQNVKMIDVHAHAVLFKEFFPPHWIKGAASVMVSAEEVIDIYDRLGIEKGILLPISSPEGQMSVLSSQSCKYLADKYPDRFSWFCNVDPRAGDNTPDGDLARILRHYKDLGAKGGEWWWENKYKFFYPGYMFHVPQAFGTLDTVADFSHIEDVYWAMKKVVNTEFPAARFIGHFSHGYDWGCMLYARFIFPGD